MAASWLLSARTGSSVSLILCQVPAQTWDWLQHSKGLEAFPCIWAQVIGEKLYKATMTRDVLETLVRRLKTMGCVSLKEDVKAQAMGLLLHWMETKGIVAPGPWPLYYLVKDFSKLFISTKAKCEVGSLAAYPWNPLDLGEEWIKKAYGPNDQPECKDIPLAMYMDKVPLRVTSQLLKDKNMPPAAKASLVPTPQQGNAPVLCNAAVPCLDFSNMCKFLLTGLCMFFFIFLPQFILRINRVLD